MATQCEAAQIKEGLPLWAFKVNVSEPLRHCVSSFNEVNNSLLKMSCMLYVSYITSLFSHTAPMLFSREKSCCIK